MPHTQTGVSRTLFIKRGQRKKLVNPKLWHAIFQEQEGKHGPGAINREKNQRNIAFEICVRPIQSGHTCTGAVLKVKGGSPLFF